MILSDALSRRPDHCPDEDHDNEDVVLLPDHLFVNLIDMDLNQRLLNAQKDFEIPKEQDELWTEETTSEGGKLIFYNGKPYVPENMEL